MNTDTAETSPSNRSAFVRFAIPAIVLVAALLGLLAYCQTTSDPRTLRELIVQSRDAYHEPWADVEEAAAALATPEAALAFVSERIATSVYEGRLQTPEAVLETRTANPADKAMLLKALLSALDVATTAHAAPLQGEERATVLADAGATGIALPEPMAALMERIGYDDDALGADQLADDLAAALLFDEAGQTVETALSHAQDLLDLDGPSSAPTAYLDWVWLEAEDGTIYDPILPEAERSELARLYGEPVVATQIAISARDRFGRTQEIVRWSGDAFGTDVSLAFYPTINTLERLIGDPDLSDVTVWTPGIVVGGELTSEAAVTLDGDVVPQSIVSTLSTDDSNSVDVSGFTAPEIASLSIASTDASTFPRVEVGLNAAVQNLPNWHGAHFRLTVDGEPVPVRIEEPFSTATHVIAVHDQTGSMRRDERFAMARAFNQTLVGGLSVGQRLAVISHNNRIRVQRVLDPIEDVVSLVEAPYWEQSVRGRTEILDALDYALNAVEIELGVGSAERTSIVLVTDGDPSSTAIEAMNDRIVAQAVRAESLNIAVYPVILSGAQTLDFARLADATGGQLIRVQSPDQIETAAHALARRLSGGMAISFEAPNDPVPDAGTVFDFTLEVAGYDGLESSSYTVPDDIIASDPEVFVEISAGEHRTVRPLVALGAAYDVNAMTGGHALYLSPGSYPSDRMTAQRLNQWLYAHDAAVDDTDAVTAHLADPAFSTAHAGVMNGLANMMSAALPDEQSLLFPLAALSHTQVVNPLVDLVGQSDNEVSLATTLDVPAWSTFLSEPASREDVARMGLALNDAEARLLGNGLNLTAIFANEAGETSQGDQYVQLASASHDDRYWWHDPETGSLFGYLQTDGLEAKGSRDVAIAQQFKDINTAIDWYLYAVQPATGAMPASAVFSGFVGFKKEELKLWCFSTIMLNYVSESIAGEPDAILNQSAAAAEARAAQLCEIQGDPRDVGERLFRAAATEIGKAVFEGVRDQLPAGLGGPPDVPAWISDQLGGNNLTDWISDPTVRAYAEQLAESGRNHVAGQVKDYAGRGFNEVSEVLQRHGLGGGRGTEGGSPTTAGFNAAMQQVIEGL
jgi:hypothetical protein